MPSNHGGARQGAGRPAGREGAPVTVYLPADLAAIAQTLGNGNASEGIRIALASFANLSIPRELQHWQHNSGEHYVIVWQGALIAAVGPLNAEQAAAMAAGDKPLPVQVDPSLADWADDEWDAGRMERIDRNE
jgi:hypothetical protein